MTLLELLRAASNAAHAVILLDLALGVAFSKCSVSLPWGIALLLSMSTLEI